MLADWRDSDAGNARVNHGNGPNNQSSVYDFLWDFQYKEEYNT